MVLVLFALAGIITPFWSQEFFQTSDLFILLYARVLLLEEEQQGQLGRGKGADEDGGILIELVDKLQGCIMLCSLFTFPHSLRLLGLFTVALRFQASCKHFGLCQRLLPCFARLGRR